MSSASSRARRCSCSTAATRSACSPAPTCSSFLADADRSRERPLSIESGADAFETRAIHAGQAPDPRPGAVVPPISLATTFAQDAVGKHRGYEYARSGNPTRAPRSRRASRRSKSARHGLAFASGLAAEDAVLRTLDPGDHVIIPTDAYGGTFRLVARVHERHGLAWTAVDLARSRRARRGVARRDPPRMDRVADQPDARRSSTSKRSPRSRTRATRASSSTTRSRRRTSSSRSRSGADVVVHSSTKYLGGHSDVVGGFVAIDDAELADERPLPAERDGRGAVAVRLLPRAARA